MPLPDPVHVVLCGGSGTRLWPMSRSRLPKQFVRLFAGKSLFQETVQRNQEVTASLMLVAGQQQYFLALDQLEELGDQRPLQTLLEPQGRNTAPAIALAAFDLAPEQPLLVTPADHRIRQQPAYQDAVQQALELAQQGDLITFGIKPTHAETGYGYIQAKGQDVLQFVEKPDAATAEQYLSSGDYLWNSGIFCFQAGAFLAELERHAPDIYAHSYQAWQNSCLEQEGSQRHIQKQDMAAIPANSIDYAVLEASNQVKVVPCDPGWNDLGSFDALYQEWQQDASGNAIEGQALCRDTQGCLIHSPQRLVATAGIRDLHIVDTPDALLIVPRGQGQRVKELVADLKGEHAHLKDEPRTTHRPWGSYTVLEDNHGYQIKKIVVKPGKRLSLQKHYHRSEHWIVVSGTAQVTRDGEDYLVRPNESTYIPIGGVHRLENPGTIDLVIIEAQVGQYTGEDDIVRLEDDWQR